jgi:hypothetical protein
MAKFKPGIPDNFSLNVEPVRDLGDYLDEPGPTPVMPRKGREPSPAKPPAAPAPEVQAPPAPIATAPPPTPAAAVQATVSPTVQPAQAAAPVMPPPQPGLTEQRIEDSREERGGKPKAPRREVSMSPETLRMTDELLEIIRSGSGQRDTYANELIHALVLLAYEAKDSLDPYSLPKRGRWGSPTARAYPRELTNAFLKALLEKHSGASEEVIRLKYPANDAA